MENLDKAFRNRIENKDIAKATMYLLNRYEKEAEKNGNVSHNTVKDNTDHTIRVLKNTHLIAKEVGCRPKEMRELEIAAILHDSGKLDAEIPGGIDTFEHHNKGARETYEFLSRELGKSEKLATKIKEAVQKHSFIPFIIAKNETMKKHPELYKPKSKQEKVLFDADVLDMTGIYGFMKIVRIRQNPSMPFFKEDNGSLKKAMESALQSAESSQKILFFRPSKLMAEKKIAGLKKLVKEINEKNIDNLSDFNQFIAIKMIEGAELGFNY